MVKVLSLGGSIVVPDEIDTEFIRRFTEMLTEFVEPEDNRAILVVGGGAPARRYQDAYRKLVVEPDAAALDWIGIGATRLNGRFIKAVLAGLCREDIVTNPSVATTFTGKILVATGWKPGFSTDFDAVILAERFSADTVVNLSNIEKVFTDDPRTNPDARPLDKLTWDEFRAIVGDTWVPGGNAPFDPIAAQKAQEIGLRVVVASGRNLENVRSILNGGDYVGTTIGPG